MWGGEGGDGGSGGGGVSVKGGGGDVGGGGGAAAAPSGASAAGGGPAALCADGAWGARRARWRSPEGGEVVGVLADDPRRLRAGEEAVPLEEPSESEAWDDLAHGLDASVREHLLLRPLTLSDLVRLVAEFILEEENKSFLDDTEDETW